MVMLQKELDSRFKTFHELMSWKVKRILLVSSPYDAWIMEKDQPLAERIIHEYRGLNLSQPPRITWVSSASQALRELESEEFELVITMPRLADMDAFILGRTIKQARPEVAVELLSHTPLALQELPPPDRGPLGIDALFTWTGNPDILVAMVKNIEDQVNVAKDTALAGIRVILLVEDSPEYVSMLLPILYRELVLQTQEVIEGGQTQEHRLLAMRARPKLLVARSYEQAGELYQKYEPFVLGVFSDVSFYRQGEQDPRAGLDLLSHIHADRFDIPLMLMSSNPDNAAKAGEVGAEFIDKNELEMAAAVRSFLKRRLGFGDFLFHTADGRQVFRASNLAEFEAALRTIPEQSLILHCRQNDLSRWLFARTEIELASSLRGITYEDFADWPSHRRHLVETVRATRRARRKGAIVDFDPQDFDAFTEFAKIGKGSMGGKARGLTFFSHLLQQTPQIAERYPGVKIHIPQAMLITTDCFDQLVDAAGLRPWGASDASDEDIAAAFLAAKMPGQMTRQLAAYLAAVTDPLAVRSSSLLEDARFRAYAGLYKTYMLSNDQADDAERLVQLVDAVKLVLASTYFQGPREFARRVGHRLDQEKMAVIIQPVCGSAYDGYFYPAISGAAMSRNYYPFERLRPEDGLALLAVGLGRTVMQGERALRFSPRHPEISLQMGSLSERMDNAQRQFYAVPLTGKSTPLTLSEAGNLSRRDIYQARHEHAVRLCTSSYIPEEDRLRDAYLPDGLPVVTFAQVLQHGLLPLGPIIADLLDLGEQGMGCPVEIEFSVNLPPEADSRPEFCVLQLRPMSARQEVREIEVTPQEMAGAFLASSQAMGNTLDRTMRDIVLVDPDSFAVEHTGAIAREIGELNAGLLKEGSKYLLIGPGRWGSADRWLGIPVQWADISAVGAMVEASYDQLRAEPSQGSHFFHNISTMGISYITMGSQTDARLDWDWLRGQPVAGRTEHVRHVRLERPFTLKVDGKTGRCAAFVEDQP